MELYKINLYYVKYLESLDKRVMWPKEHGFMRPYVGIVLTINGYRFFGPLTSNRQNKNNWAIIKLTNAEGSIFLANMIPVPEIYLTEIVSAINIDDYMFSESNDISNYGLKLFAQFETINTTLIKNSILKKSKRIYKLQKYSEYYKKLCCDFSYLQQMSIFWNISYWYLFWYLKSNFTYL